MLEPDERPRQLAASFAAMAKRSLVLAACAVTGVAGFTGVLPSVGLRRAGPAHRICMADDEINSKKVAG